jgi:hypothetical protein
MAGRNLDCSCRFAKALPYAVQNSPQDDRNTE